MVSSSFTSSPSSSMSNFGSSSTSSASDALYQLMEPDGYYTYLNIPKPALNQGISDASSTTAAAAALPMSIDEDLVKKSYRKLSLKHHPDKPGGDVDTFRLLNRAQKVLLSPTLRQEYDILGIDLDDNDDDDDDDNQNHHHNTNDGGAAAAGADDDGNSKPPKNHHHAKEKPSTAQKIIHELCTVVLTGVFQFVARTIVMGFSSVVVIRFRWTFYPAMAFMAYIGWNVARHVRKAQTTSIMSIVGDLLPPLLISIGLILMHTAASHQRAWSSSSISSGWTWQFWMGESLVLAMFLYNSFPTIPRTVPIVSGVTLFAMVVSLWFRGNLWNYLTVIGLEALLAIFVMIAFPVFDLLLESILNDKLRRVGDKVRAHHHILQQHYRSKSNN